MGLITKTVKMKWNAKNKKYYEELGYIFTNMSEEFDVKVEDLKECSEQKLECICDSCGKKIILRNNTYRKNNKKYQKIYCTKCKNKIIHNNKKRRHSFKKSFYEWCIEKNRQDILDRWDYELNDYSPNEISYGTTEKYWFKCNKHLEHKSELKSICHFTGGQEGSIYCRQCNSIAQYIIDIFPDKKLKEVWDYEKNEDLDPWSVNKSSGIKIWIKCQEKDYHGSYKVKCNDFFNNCRCPYCNCRNGKIHSLDSLGQYIIDNYGEEFLWKVWSDKNEKSPFKITPNSNKKYWWNCPDDKHESFYRKTQTSKNCEFRCPKCVQEREESIIEEKVRLYLKELGYKVNTEYKCSIKPINPKSKLPLPFDNEIVLENSRHLIIEVHGVQHYKIDGLYTKTKKELEYQQYKDKYKKDYCIKVNYEYLEIPYTAFNKDDTYKKLIDNKIKEILES